MIPLLFLALAFAPGVFWMWFFYSKDRYEREPKMLILKTFFLGVFVVVPAAILEIGTEMLLPLKESFATIVASSFVVAFIEEPLKFLVVRLGAFKSREFNEVMDGIVYAAASAMGFASLENFFYMKTYGVSIIVLRAPLSTLGHVLFSGMWGYALGISKVYNKKNIVLGGLSLSILFHGAYNSLLVSGNSLAAFLVLPFMFYMYKVLSKKIRYSLEKSPFKTVFCKSCGFENKRDSLFCGKCGLPL